MRIAMIGTGYVGLVSGACIADFGHEVTCVDKDGTKICALNSGEIPIYEPGLKDIVQSNVRQARLQFTTALSEALKGANTAFIAVGTPSRRGDGHADLSYVYEAAREIAAALILPSSLPSRRSRWVRAMRSNALFASCGLTSMLPLSQIPNSCEKEPRSTISSTLIESSSGPTTNARKEFLLKSTARFT